MARSKGGRKTPVINSHIIPAFYLEQFSTPSDQRSWRPWEQPGADWIQDWLSKFSLDGGTPIALTLRLKRILWAFRATYPHDPYREKKLYFHERVSAEHPDPNMQITLALLRRRFQLRSWLNGIPRPHRYAKAYECWDFNSRIPPWAGVCRLVYTGWCRVLCLAKDPSYRDILPAGFSRSRPNARE